MRKNRSSLLFASCLAIAGILLVQMAMYVLHVMLGFQLRFNLFEVCTIWLESLGFDSLIYPMNGLVFYTLAGAAALTFRQLWLSRSMAGKLASLRDDRLTGELNRRYPEGQADLTVIAHREPMAFTMGFVAPRIVLSTGLLELLDERETEAVIHHERFHKRHRDPLRMYVLSLLAVLMWYLPILKWLHRNYKLTRELLADDHAISAMGSSAFIGSALLKLLKRVSGRRERKMLALAHVSFADTSVNCRIRRILDPQETVPLEWPITPLMVSLHVLALLTAMFFIGLIM